VALHPLREVGVSVRTYLYGEVVAAAASRDEPLWLRLRLAQRDRYDRHRSLGCPEKGSTMPLFMVERKLAETFDPDDETLRFIDQYHLDNDIKWITSFLSPDKKKTFCLYEVEDVEVLRKHAADLGLPADTITQVGEFVR
jgi:hypothetical protein